MQQKLVDNYFNCYIFEDKEIPLAKRVCFLGANPFSERDLNPSLGSINPALFHLSYGPIRNVT